MEISEIEGPHDYMTKQDFWKEQTRLYFTHIIVVKPFEGVEEDSNTTTLTSN